MLEQRRGTEKSLGKGRGCGFGSSPKWLERPHHELVHWWLLVYTRDLALAQLSSVEDLKQDLRKGQF
jgi:hypothetical protein